jgi:sulfhydrogenase subunit beta (sulfur reductase)
MTEAYIISQQQLLEWVASLSKTFDVFGPVTNKKGQTVFESVSDPEKIDMLYCSTMLAPRNIIYPARQILFKIDRLEGKYETVLPEYQKRKLIFAIHPCDMHAISVLDKTFLGAFKDTYYKQLREDTVTIVLNCNHACDNGFCPSMGTGPFLQLKSGFDVVITAKWDDYLVEAGSQTGERILKEFNGGKRPAEKDFVEKAKIEESSRQSFTKQLETAGLPELLMRNLEHPVYEKTADSRCLGCTNCTMVCPTCYCYNIEDITKYDLKTTSRNRYWDSCQELHFAQVHEGNFRSSRKARLRQFMVHKLATWLDQFGCFGCIGCGRCMTWCPTKIDITDMSKEIQQDFKKGIAK